MATPKISIITTVHNIPDDLLELNVVTSTSQTLEDIEIIYGLDNTTESNAKLVKHAAARDKRIKVLEFTSPMGIGRTFNSCLMQATGEFIAPIDGDDNVDNHFYENLYRKAKTTGAEVVKGNVALRKDGKLITTLDLNKDIAYNHNQYKFTWQYWSAIYNRKFLFENGIFLFPDTKKNAESLFLVKVGVNANVVLTLDDVFYNYVRRENSVDSDYLTADKIRDSLNVRNCILKYLMQVKSCISIDHFSWVCSEQVIRAFIEATRAKDNEALQTAAKGIWSLCDTIRKVDGWAYHKEICASIKSKDKDLDIQELVNLQYIENYIRGSEYVPAIQ